MSAGARDPIVIAERNTAEGVALELEIPADLAWCRGHFPGSPIVPGVVLVHWALAEGRRRFATPGAAPLALQVKFRHPIRPGDRLTLELGHASARRRLSFAYRAADEIRASGQATFAP